MNVLPRVDECACDRCEYARALRLRAVLADEGFHLTEAEAISVQRRLSAPLVLA